MESRINLNDLVGKVVSRGFHATFIGGIVAYCLCDKLSEQFFQSQQIYEFTNYVINITSAYAGARIGWFAGAINAIPAHFKRVKDTSKLKKY